MTDIVFTLRLDNNDWDGHRAWRCPALDIPTAYIKAATDQNGTSRDVSDFAIEKGPARVVWRGGNRRPSQIELSIGLKEKLSPVSEVEAAKDEATEAAKAERRWKKIAILASPVAVVVAAAIGAVAGYMNRPPPMSRRVSSTKARSLPTAPRRRHRVPKPSRAAASRADHRSLCAIAMMIKLATRPAMMPSPIPQAKPIFQAFAC